MASFLASQILHPERIVLPADRQLDLRHLPPGPSIPAAAMARGWGGVCSTETKYEDTEGMCLIYFFILGKLLEMPNPV